MGPEWSGMPRPCLEKQMAHGKGMVAAEEAVVIPPISTTIELTPAAVEKVRALMRTEKSLPAGAGLRVAVVDGGCAGQSYKLTFETQVRDADEVLEFDGLKVYVDQKSSAFVRGTTLDFVEGLNAAGFQFLNPNVQKTCGCGSSFKV